MSQVCKGLLPYAAQPGLWAHGADLGHGEASDRRIVRALLNAIERGDARAAKRILDRIWPAPATKGEPKPVIKLAVDAQDLEV